MLIYKFSEKIISKFVDWCVIRKLECVKKYSVKKTLDRFLQIRYYIK